MRPADYASANAERAAAHKDTVNALAKDNARLKAELDRLKARIADVRSYAQITLDSISLERRAMASDVLDLLGGSDE